MDLTRPDFELWRGRLQGDVVMLLPGVAELFCAEEVQVLTQPLTGCMWHNDVVDEATAGSDQWMRELVHICCCFFHKHRRRPCFTAVEDLDGALWAHDGDLGSGPRIVHITAQMCRGHHIVCTAVRFARDHGDLGNRRLGVRKQQLGAMSDDAVELLLTPWEEARDVDESDDGYVEGVTEANPASGLDGSVDVQTPCCLYRLIRHNTNRPPLHASEANDDVLRVLGHDLE
mmetsp:Transcript_25923/g.44603  ORF Transcript_25923/g.44603 Transcript_25923/m.44603 type:complete len:230 (-) Transcript_25923:551-1240(-)